MQSIEFDGKNVVQVRGIKYNGCNVISFLNYQAGFRIDFLKKWYNYLINRSTFYYLHKTSYQIDNRALLYNENIYYNILYSLTAIIINSKNI